jgi:hypothetical protein
MHNTQPTCLTVVPHDIPFRVPYGQNFVELSDLETPERLVATDLSQAGIVADYHTTRFGLDPQPYNNEAEGMSTGALVLLFHIIGLSDSEPIHGYLNQLNPDPNFIGILSREEQDNPESRLQITFVDLRTKALADPAQIPAGFWCYSYTAREPYDALEEDDFESRPAPGRKPLFIFDEPETESPYSLDGLVDLCDRLPELLAPLDVLEVPFINELYEEVEASLNKTITDTAQNPLLLDILRGDSKLAAEQALAYIAQALASATKKAYKL